MKRFVEGSSRALAFAALLGLVFGCSNRPKPDADMVEDPSGDGTDVTEETTSGDVGEDDAAVWRNMIKDIFFDYDKYDLRSDTRSILQENARLLKERTGTQVTLEGHCDERGTNEYNLALGQRRADAVRTYLVDLGVSGSNLRTVSYGEEQPFNPGSNEAAWAQNRRVHFNFE